MSSRQLLDRGGDIYSFALWRGITRRMPLILTVGVFLSD